MGSFFSKALVIKVLTSFATFLGKIILRHTETLLQCYTVYCVNYDEATVLLSKLLKKKSDFRRWHDKVSKSWPFYM